MKTSPFCDNDRCKYHSLQVAPYVREFRDPVIPVTPAPTTWWIVVRPTDFFHMVGGSIRTTILGGGSTREGAAESAARRAKTFLVDVRTVPLWTEATRGPEDGVAYQYASGNCWTVRPPYETQSVPLPPVTARRHRWTTPAGRTAFFCDACCRVLEIVYEPLTPDMARMTAAQVASAMNRGTLPGVCDRPAIYRATADGKLTYDVPETGSQLLVTDLPRKDYSCD